jgi:hypothetical protein
MVALSVAVWQDRQPALFASACTAVCSTGAAGEVT